jgi:dTDP-4-dehydrorhamnose reductase
MVDCHTSGQASHIKTNSREDLSEVALPKILILGGTGMLGHKLFQYLLPRFPSTICTMHGNASETPYSRIAMFQGPNAIQGINVFDFEKLSALLLHFRPDFIVNCIGIIKQRSEASAPIPTITLNALLPHRLAELATRWDGRLIHISTDCVFSGMRGMYTEDDFSDALDLYGKSKYLGETMETNALTIRTSIIGRELTNHRSLLDWFLSNVGGRVKGYRKSIYSGVTTNHLSEVICDIIVRHPRLQGLYQVASEAICKYDLLCFIRDAYGFDVAIEEVDGEHVNRSMDGSRFRIATGYVSPPWQLLVRQLAVDPTPYTQWLGLNDKMASSKL